MEIKHRITTHTNYQQTAIVYLKSSKPFTSRKWTKRVRVSLINIPNERYKKRLQKPKRILTVTTLNQK